MTSWSATDDLEHQVRLHDPVSDCPLIDGNRVALLPSGADAVRAIMRAIEAARDHIHMEYYTLDDVRLDGLSLFALLEERARSGVEVAVIWDAVGSGKTPDRRFERLRQAGAQVLEYHSVNPLRRRFNLHLNDRDHRKLTVIDGRVGFLGGANMSRVYETPESVGRGPDPDHAFWIDSAVRIDGPAVAEIQKLFFHTWHGQEGERAPLRGEAGTGSDVAGPAPATKSGATAIGETLRIDGSAPGERRPLYNHALRAALNGARHRVVLATGYFVPTNREWRLLAATARRGVSVDLLLPGYSDVPPAVHAARALYGRLLAAGIRIHEVRRAMLHAKVGTIDGVWTAIGSSNLDRRSVYYNNEIDAIVLGRPTAGAVEAMLRAEIARAVQIRLRDWTGRSLREHIAEQAARVWKQLM
ncbi:phospholipase D-like domain-containing protein [Lichenicoccus sp.]|uniref:phospholipase D-like domain-containing protein n=1 Tax=Lichenicoccus sp. TaxID=2781899 RepID=UPI003D096CA9